MDDVITKDGFPKGWMMVHRPDTTLLMHTGGLLSMGTTICAAPRLVQGQAWLATAQRIAWALADDQKRQLDVVFAAFCDRCGVGAPCDEHGEPLPTTRALQTWTCDRCDHVNPRPAPPSA